MSLAHKKDTHHEQGDPCTPRQTAGWDRFSTKNALTRESEIGRGLLQVPPASFFDRVVARYL